MTRPLRAFLFVTALFASCAAFVSCSGGGGGGGMPDAAGRSFLMGSTPFSFTMNAGTLTYPDWKFENMDDRDLLSVHVDDFWGVPWNYCNALTCTGLPAAFVSRWQQLAGDAKVSGKVLYLAVSPLGNRRTLAPTVLTDGSPQANWNASVDGAGCYLFASDPNALKYRDAYISYLKYVINLVGPAYMSPAIEMNIPFTSCPTQKSAWIAWYTGVHAALKSAYPALVIFPTFQQEVMYGIADAQSACAVGTLTQCFDQRLGEALSIPGDRIAFSTYPIAWKFRAEFGFSYPPDVYARTRARTNRRIWVSETGWSAVKLLQSYPHGGAGTCGADLLPETLTVPGAGTIGVANEAAHAAYVSWLLGQAQTQGMEAVIWWLNRDYLDDTVAATCPCSPATSDTCAVADLFYLIASDAGEQLLRLFGNMGLRRIDGTARPGQAVWHSFVLRPYRK